jgi:hypothetical protein
VDYGVDRGRSWHSFSGRKRQTGCPPVRRTIVHAESSAFFFGCRNRRNRHCGPDRHQYFNSS